MLAADWRVARRGRNLMADIIARCTVVLLAGVAVGTKVQGIVEGFVQCSGDEYHFISVLR
jgi:ABC-type thiamin/hydroxymethylpyrimidine transport system permease subunit